MTATVEQLQEIEQRLVVQLNNYGQQMQQQQQQQLQSDAAMTSSVHAESLRSKGAAFERKLEEIEAERDAKEKGWDEKPKPIDAQKKGPGSGPKNGPETGKKRSSHDGRMQGGSLDVCLASPRPCLIGPKLGNYTNPPLICKLR